MPENERIEGNLDTFRCPLPSGGNRVLEQVLLRDKGESSPVEDDLDSRVSGKGLHGDPSHGVGDSKSVLQSA